MRIASLQPSVSIILERLGCGEALVACTRYCLEAVPELRQRGLAVVHDSWSTNSEELQPVRPDLVIASVPYRDESLKAILKAGVPVLTLAPHSLADVEQDIRLIAAVAGVPKRGEALAEEMRSRIEAVRRKTSELVPKPRVYCEEWGKPLIHSQVWVKELVEAAGGVFVGEAGTVTTPEAVAAADPEVIVAAWCGAGDRVPLEKVAGRRGWEGIAAVRTGQVYCIADELLNTPAPTLVGGLEALAAALHPGRFVTAGTLRRLNINRTPSKCV
jgi:iron complex transport system substrate-binding protein